ncbi:MAG: amidase [Acidobacteriota bacterium]
MTGQRDTASDSRGTGTSRRSFLQRGAMGAALAAVGGVAAGRATGSSRRGRAAAEPFALAEKTVRELQEGMESGTYTTRAIVDAYVARVRALDRQGLALNHILEINPDAARLADQLDAERQRSGARGPLHGIPVLLKDNVGTADRMATAAGSLALAHSRPRQDSFVARQLRAAGAVLLGKTNLSEWANFRSTHSSSGWSARGGQCLNPYALDRSPCGSSSGSAAAIAANLGSVAIGTETDGSIVCPAAANSLVGIKPTVGLVSRAGIVPLSHSQDTAGPMARTVADAALLLGALTGVDAGDEATLAGRGKARSDYARFLDPRGLRGARIGVPRKRFFGYSDPTDRIVEAALQAMSRAGAVIVDPADLPHAGEYDESEFSVLLFDFKEDINRYLSSLDPPAPVRTLAELIDFNERHRDRELPYFGQEIFHMAQEKGPLTSEEYMKALAESRRLSREEGIDAVMNQHALDALVMPTGGPPWTIDLVNGDHFSGGSSTPAAVAGYPSITVPAGYAFGLPVGISFTGRAYSEPILIKLAYAFEQATRVRRAPRFLPQADLHAAMVEA